MLICFSFLKTDFNSASLFQLKQVEKSSCQQNTRFMEYTLILGKEISTWKKLPLLFGCSKGGLTDKT